MKASHWIRNASPTDNAKTEIPKPAAPPCHLSAYTLTLQLNDVMSAPALMIDEEVMSSGRIPRKEDITEWIPAYE